MFENKTVLVTGGSGAIGQAISLDFAKQGANLIVNYSNNEPIELIKKINELYPATKCVGYKANVADFKEVQEMIKFIKNEFSTLDFVVNNAGITRDNLLIGMKEEEFDEVIDINLKGAFNVMRHATKIMLKQKSGSIINISSVVGILGNIGQVNYSASKAGMIGMTKSVAREVASRGITVNAVAPGFIETPMTDKLNEEIRENTKKIIPLGTFGTPEDVSSVVIFLAQNKYITGQVISVDGGMSM